MNSVFNSECKKKYVAERKQLDSSSWLLYITFPKKSIEHYLQIQFLYQCKDDLSTKDWPGHTAYSDLSPAMSAMLELAMADFFSRASFSNFFFVNLKGIVQWIITF